MRTKTKSPTTTSEHKYIPPFEFPREFHAMLLRIKHASAAEQGEGKDFAQRFRLSCLMSEVSRKVSEEYALHEASRLSDFARMMCAESWVIGLVPAKEYEPMDTGYVLLAMTDPVLRVMEKFWEDHGYDPTLPKEKPPSEGV